MLLTIKEKTKYEINLFNASNCNVMTMMIFIINITFSYLKGSISYRFKGPTIKDGFSTVLKSIPCKLLK